MNWIIIVIAGHILNAFAFLMDKFLLTKKISSPFVYAFFIGVLGILGAVLIPFGFMVPSAGAIIRALLGGATFVWALIFFFAALKENETSRVVPLSGGLVPGFTLLFAYFLLDERLGTEQLAAFTALVLGGVLVTIEPSAKRGSMKGYFYAVCSAAIFGFSSVIMKYVYLEQAFVSGFVWSRFGGLAAALLILLLPKERYAIFHQPKQKNKGKTAALFFTGQAAGALGFIILAYAISLASPSLVNAMQGVQYAFLLVAVILLSKKFPKILKEKLTARVLAQKIIAIVLISIGIGLIAW